MQIINKGGVRRHQEVKSFSILLRTRHEMGRGGSRSLRLSNAGNENVTPTIP